MGNPRPCARCMPINPRMHSSPSSSRFGLRSCGRRETILTSTSTARYTQVGMERCVGGVSVDTIVTRSYAFYGECEPTYGTDGLWFDRNARATQPGTGMTLANPEHRISTIGITTA